MTRTSGPVHAARSFWAYVAVLKPRETALLAFVGVVAASVAGGGQVEARRFALVSLAILLGSAGCNGLTNYLDRDMDARMQRTRQRPLPAGHIVPPELVLPWAGALVAVGLGIALYLNPLAFLCGLAGVVAAMVCRKRSFTHVPLGEVSSCAPVLVGWLGVQPRPDWTLAALCAIVATWTPIHVWSLMTAYGDDYRQAGVGIFPLWLSPPAALRLLLALALLLLPVSLLPYLLGSFGRLYLAAALVLGAAVIYASLRLLHSGAGRDAWRVYKLSAYPYLGLLFLAMWLDRLL